MVQPRKEQVKNLKTRHSRVTYFPTAGEAYTQILDASMYSQVISDTPGGAQENTKAIIISSTTALYNTILAGDAINIYVDDPNPTLVTFAATDITASRIAATINAAVGSDVALDNEGTLVLFSSQSGDDAYITLENSVSGTLSKLGLTAGTYNGVSAPTRGIVTAEADIESIGGSDFIRRGGFVPVRSGDGRVVTTDANSSSILHVDNGTYPTLRRIDIPGGMPIHGRIVRNSKDTGYWILYYAQMPTEATVKTFNSDFANLDGTDSLTIGAEIDYRTGPGYNTKVVNLTVTFPAGPYDRDSTITRINEVFATDVAAGSGKAFVVGTISQPFTLDSTDDGISIAVDGGAAQFVTFLGTEKTASEVAARISLLTGVTASPESTTGNNELVKISSDETDGTISSLDIQNSGVSDTLQKLGIIPGLYRGVFIAEPYGDDEIILKGLNRGGNSKLDISGNAPTLVRMGLTAGTYYGENGGEVKVDFPTLDQITNSDAFSYLLVPEIVEYGETDLKVESTLQEFDSNFGVSPGGKGSNTVTDGAFGGFSKGITDTGKPVTVNALGQVDTTLVRAVRDDLQNTFKKFIVGDFTPGVNSVEKLVAAIIQTPGVEGNPQPKPSFFSIDVDPDESYPGPFIQFRFWRDTGNSYTPFRFGYDSSALYSNFEWYLYLNTDAGIAAEDILWLADTNTVQAGLDHVGLKDLPLTDSTGGRYPRVFELETNDTTQPSLIGHANARWSVTVGDGTNSFGDFSGSDAIEQALAYFDANVSAYYVCHILIKPGTYISSGYTLTNNILYVFQGMETGFASSGSRRAILQHSGAGALFTQTNGSGGIFLRGLTIEKTGTGNLAIDAQTNPVNAEYVFFNDLGIKTQIAGSTNGPPFIALKRCLFAGTGGNAYMTSPIPCVEMEFLFTYGYRSTVFEDCVFKSAYHNPVLRITDAATTVPNVRTGKILFDRCRLDMRSTTDNGGGNLTGNSGALELVPYDTGDLTISDIEWRDCTVTTDTGAARILLYVRTDNGTEYINIDKLTIKGGSWLAASGVTAFNPFYIGGETYSSDPHINQVNLFDTTIGFEGSGESNYGVVTNEVGGADETGAVCIAANEWLRIHNVQWNYLTVRSQMPDFYLVPYNGTIDVDGLYLDRGYGEVQNYGTPLYRLHIGVFGSNDYGYHKIKNLRIRQRDGSLSTNLPATDAAVNIRGWNITFEECDIGGFNQGSGAPCFKLQANEAQYITFVRCEMIAADYGIYGNYGTTSMYGMKIYNCRINNMTEYGISLMNYNGSYSIAEAIIDGNHIKNCTTGGIRFAPGTWGSSMTIMNNLIEGGSSTNRIRLSETDAINSAAETGANAAGMVQNNNLRGGRLNLIGGPTGGLPPGELWGVACVFRDTEPGADHNLGVAQWWVINATEMLYNYGDYYNPAK